MLITRRNPVFSSNSLTMATLDILGKDEIDKHVEKINQKIW
ncbi:MAG: hypothetical protein N2F24_06305 [Deltaproteobacteria bacterium]